MLTTNASIAIDSLHSSILKQPKMSGRNKESLNNKINAMWQLVISAYGYEKYYLANPLINSFKAKAQYYDKHRVFSEYKKLLYSYGLSYDRQYLLQREKTASSTSKYIISSDKIWMMLIMITFDSSNSIEIVLKQFNEALRKVANHIALFELFIIVISEMSSEAFTQAIMVNDRYEIPIEFKNIYAKNERALKEIFNEDKVVPCDNATSLSAFQYIPFKDSSLFGYSYTRDSNSNDLNYSFSKSVGKGKEHSFSQLINDNDITDMAIVDICNSDELLCNIDTNTIEGMTNSNSEDENNQKRKGSSHTLDEYLSPKQSLNDYVLITKDYINRGHFAIFSKEEKEEEEESEHVLIPLKPTFSPSDKGEVRKTLSLIRRSAFGNFEYHPYSEEAMKIISDFG